MRFINNWLTQLTGQLLAGATALPITGDALARLGPGAGGECLLTITSSLDPLQQSNFEVVRVTFSGGAAVLQRGREGTADQTWLAGSYIYAAVTAGHLADLTARIEALEAGGGIPDGALAFGGDILSDEQSRILTA